MRRFTTLLAFAFAAFGLLGCGATIGDPCTTPNECGDKLCLNKDFTPGGYCSQQCVVGDSNTCPAGSTCIKDGAGAGINACFLQCDRDQDCRTGYACRRIKDQQFTVCVAPEGI